MAMPGHGFPAPSRGFPPPELRNDGRAGSACCEGCNDLPGRRRCYHTSLPNQRRTGCCFCSASCCSGGQTVGDLHPQQVHGPRAVPRLHTHVFVKSSDADVGGSECTGSPIFSPKEPSERSALGDSRREKAGARRRSPSHTWGAEPAGPREPRCLCTPADGGEGSASASPAGPRQGKHGNATGFALLGSRPCFCVCRSRRLSRLFLRCELCTHSGTAFTTARRVVTTWRSAVNAP